MPVKIPLHLFSHEQKIGSLYKKWLRHMQGVISSREEYLFKATLVRCDFDLILKEKDMIKSKKMLMDKEDEFQNSFHLEPVHFPDSPKGDAYERDLIVSDLVLDLWHPYEKAAFSDYFTRRELRKQQYIEMWEKIHGPPPPQNIH